jgi:hypothetical protein
VAGGDVARAEVHEREWPFDGWLESAWEALDSREIELRKAAGD